MIREIEEISMNAWPALQTLHYDGWILRFANGVTKRLNSVNPIYASKINVDDKIDYCENLYRSQNLPPCFRITEIVQPSGLDQKLETHGYDHVFDVSVQLVNINQYKFALDKNIQITEVIEERWLDDYIRMNDVNPENKAVLKRIIDQIMVSRGLFTLRANGMAVGCGLGVTENKHIGLFDIVIDKSWRNQGLGQILIESILAWGKSKGAEYGYLQVMADNAPAVRLYSKAGFREEYRYWYRMKGG
jgi:ribosomal protein S18 acetylase RimI-like enzyme